MSIGEIDAPSLRQAILGGGEFALIDVREAGPFVEAHILTASNLPLSSLELHVRRLVPGLQTTIVVCDGGEGTARQGAVVLEGMGYTDVAVLPGGSPAWQAAGYELFWGSNVPSKAFGEIVEATCHTPALDAEEVKARVDRGDNLVILDGRPWAEYTEFNIPGGIDCPNSELAYRVRDLVPDPETTIVVNCAGRTRSIIGSQTLCNAGVPNPVFALRNGTIGWEWAGLELEWGASRRYGDASDDARAWAHARCDDLACRTGVKFIDMETLGRWREESDETTLYVFDVRDPSETQVGTLPGAVPAEGTQLVQATDTYVAVRDARIVLVDDTGVRARMTGHWLRQLLFPNVAVLDVDVRDHAEPPPQASPPDAPSVAAPDVGERAILDFSLAMGFITEHPEGAFWGLRARLDEVVTGLPAGRGVALIDDADGHLAALAIPELRQRGINAVLIAGGLAAWKAAGLPTSSGRENMLSTMEDMADFPFDLAGDPDAAKRHYIDWELQLPEQMERDGLLRFSPLAD